MGYSQLIRIRRIGEGVPIPDSPGEEATFINSLNCHRLLMSTVPSFGDKVVVGCVEA